jgi:nucleoside-diphosphate-sugar epimerase
VKILVFGGTRFIGRRLVGDLVAAGHKVILYNRGATSDPFGGAVERIKGDRRSSADLLSGLARREFDAVYDFLSYEAADARLVIESLAGRVGRFVHISTCSVYWCTGDFPCPVPEEDFDRLGEFPEKPGSIEYDYGYNKRKAEEALFAAHKERGFPVTTIRLPIVGGEDDPTQRYASYCLRVSDGGSLVLPDGGYAPFRHVYVADVARMLAALPGIPRAVGQAYNLACDEILSVRSVVAWIAALLGHKVDTVEIPTPALRALGVGTAFSPFTQQAAQVPAIFKARRDLAWAPTPYCEWLERTVRWCMDTRRSRAEAPPAYAHREAERAAAEAYRRALRSSSEGGDGPGATFSGRPG